MNHIKPIAEVDLAEMPAVLDTRQLRMMPPADVPVRAIIQTTPSSHDTYSTRPGYGLTPDRVYRIYRAAEAGMPAEQCDMFEDVVENDGHLGGLVNNRIESVSGRPWIVKPGDSTPISAEAAARLEDALVEANTDEFIEHQLNGVFMGWSLSEVAWEMRDGWWVPTWFINVAHRRFAFDEFDMPRLTTELSPWPGEALRGSWAMTATRHRQVVRGGLLRGATWWSVFKRMSVRDWIVFAEKFGIPIPIGIYKGNAPEETRRVVEQAILDIGNAGAAVMSDAAQIIFADHARASGDNSGLHPSVVALCNSEQSKLITGATLSVETGGPGSFALGKVHADRALILSIRDAKRLASMFRRWVGSVFLRLNGIRGVRPPTLVAQVLPETDQLTRAKVASILANELDMELDEGQVRDEFGWRPPADGTTPVKGSKKPDAPTTPTDEDDDDDAA
jgi:phage gp29-like protein